MSHLDSLREKISIEFTHYEAVVLITYLTRINNLTYPPDDPIEQKILYDLEAQLDRALFRHVRPPEVPDVLASSRELVAQDME